MVEFQIRPRDLFSGISNSSKQQYLSNYRIFFECSFLENKEEVAYAEVFEVMLDTVHQFAIRVNLPQIILTDFELAIINSSKVHSVNVHAC